MFTESDLAKAAAPGSYERGIDYVRYVVGLRTESTSARASIQARNVYDCRLMWRRGLSGECTCPHNADGNFCKHLVAVGLAVLAEQPTPVTESNTEAIDLYLRGLEPAELAGLVRALVARDESALHFVQARAMSGGVPGAVDAEAVTRRVNDALPRGWVDYRESFPAAQRVQALLDELADLVEAGAADVVRPGLERVVTRLQKVHADDSGGVLGDACQRAVELHAEACCAGSVDARRLGRWLAKLRLESPGWPLVTLQMYAPALGEDGIASYRAAATKASAARRESSFLDRFEIDRMLVELADHDGDLDAAIETLSQSDEHTSYGAIIDRLDAAGRSADALRWTDRAVAAGKLTPPWLGANEFWLSPRVVARRYLGAGRTEDALAVARNHFRAHIGVQTLNLLIEVGSQASTADAEREWAMAIARAAAARRHDGSELVQLALDADDLPGAWSAAEQFGAGATWRALAEASYDDLPVAAADLYRPELERLLAFADTSRYSEIATILRTMRDLYARVGEADVIDAEIAAIRDKYRRRTSLIAQLDRARLP